jgi:preprotein translocase subunit SecG
MINTLLMVQIAIGILLVAAILLQRTSSDGLGSLGGSNMNVMSAGSASNFIHKATVILVITFMSNGLLLANLSTHKDSGISKKLQEEIKKEESSAVPIAK